MRIARLATLLLCLAAPAFAAHFPYVFTRGDRPGNLHASGVDIRKAVRLSKEIPGPMLWFRLDGQSYVVRDAALLAEVREAFEPVSRLEPQYRDLQRRIRPLERREEELDARHDAIEDADDDDDDDAAPRSPADEAELARLDRELDQLHAQLRKLEAEEERLDREQDALEREAERKLDEIVQRAIRRGLAEKY